jgi:hypothetical protein
MGEPSDSLHPRLIEIMSRMEADRVAGDFDFIGYKDEIVVLHTQFPDEEHKIQAIVLYGMLINYTCGNIEASGGDATGLRNVAVSEHKMFLIKEAQDSEGNIDPDELARVTRREIKAGRMREADGLAKLADAGSKVLGKRPPDEEKPGLWKRLFG